jgi:DNA-binding transcriptional ArsR family regulator
VQQGLEAISHPGRRAMLGLLLAGERSAGELAQHTGMRQPVASQHLRVLRDAGLVRVRKDGNRRVYSVDFPNLGRLRSELDAFWQPALAALKSAAEHAARHEHRE